MWKLFCCRIWGLCFQRVFDPLCSLAPWSRHRHSSADSKSEGKTSEGHSRSLCRFQGAAVLAKQRGLLSKVCSINLSMACLFDFGFNACTAGPAIKTTRIVWLCSVMFGSYFGCFGQVPAILISSTVPTGRSTHLLVPRQPRHELDSVTGSLGDNTCQCGSSILMMVTIVKDKQDHVY